MEDEGERRDDLCERVLAWPADLTELRPYAGEDLGGPRDMGAESVHVRFARPCNRGGVRQLGAAGGGKRIKVALDAGRHASRSRLDVAAGAVDGRVAGSERGAEQREALSGGRRNHKDGRAEDESARNLPQGDAS